MKDFGYDVSDYRAIDPVSEPWRISTAWWRAPTRWACV